MQLGKNIRLERIINRTTKRCIVVPMDHGVSIGPVSGIENMRHAVSEMSEGGADAVLMHKGMVRCSHRSEGKDLGLIVHLSASSDLSPNPNAKNLVATVEDAIRLGADAVSVHVNVGAEQEPEMLAHLGSITSKASEWGMPVLAMMYARGPKIKNQFDAELVAHCARVGAELGADIIKVNYTGDIDSFSRVIEGCCVPVVIAGGERTNTTEEFLRMVHDSIRAGGTGLSVGRNVFQHARRVELLKALRGIVHEDWSVDKALKFMGEK